RESLYDWRSRARRALALRVHAPGPRAPARHVEEEPAIEDRQFALVDRREEHRSALELPVEQEIGDGHHAAGQEGGPPGEEAERDRGAAQELDEAADPDLMIVAEFHGLPEDAEDFLHAVERKHQAGDDPQQRVSAVRER